jgi:excisionase family DNA binding protein
MKRYLKVKEVMEMLGVSKPTIYRWVKEGRLEAIKFGKDNAKLFIDALSISPKKRSPIVIKKEYTPSELASELGVSTRQVLRWIKDGLIKAEKRKGKYGDEWVISSEL